METFEDKLKLLEERGYISSGDLQCPAVGGDHFCEIWEHPKGAQAEVCQTCETVIHK